VGSLRSQRFLAAIMEELVVLLVSLTNYRCALHKGVSGTKMGAFIAHMNGTSTLQRYYLGNQLKH
jgi:hypothetical protein